MYKKTMREALKEARAYRDPIDEGITGNIQKAITIAKKMGGNMTGAIKEIEKIAKGLSDDPSVRAALKTANESLDEAKDLMLTYGKPGGDGNVSVENKIDTLFSTLILSVVGKISYSLLNIPLLLM